MLELQLPLHGDRRGRLGQVLDASARLLPGQGPISVFIHHNTLHAYEDLPFEQAVVVAGRRFGCEPFLSEARYRDELARGRIGDGDLRRALELELGPGAHAAVGTSGARAGGVWGTRLDLRHLLLRHAIEEAAGHDLTWLLDETDILHRLRPDLPDTAVRRLFGEVQPSPRRQRRLLDHLWRACQAAAAATPHTAPQPGAWVRHRDGLLLATGADSDALVHPALIRHAAAFLDQGLAPWPLLERERGFLRAFVALRVGERRSPEGWWRRLQASLPAEDVSDAAASVLSSLHDLGVGEDEWETFLPATLLALRGWAGMMRQIEARPDRVFAQALPASLLEFLAVRLLLERAALAHLAAVHLGYEGPLEALRGHLRAREPVAERVDRRAGAFVLFQLAQLSGLGPHQVEALAAEDVAALFAEVKAFHEGERRRMFQLAFERRYRVELLDALAIRAERPATPPDPTLQAIFCIDEREESIRRHLEEVRPATETFGVAGFFGVAMHYRGVGDAHAAPLCPIAVKPRHEVHEVALPASRDEERRRALARRTVGRLAQRLQLGSRTLARGTMIASLLGALAAVPLVARVLFPRLTALFRRRARALFEPVSDTELLLDRRADGADGERHLGFAKEEMAAIVGGVLADIGLLGRGVMAPLVLVVGHGSSSLNNPHESAHDCGACGGGRGGPNARAFVQMANDPAVRALLAARGTPLPEGTRFLAMMHDSCDDSIRVFDAERLPAAWRSHLADAEGALEVARARNAHERCRKFESAPTWLPPALALAHVEARAEDLAQVRPEYGHATNAMAFVGRRSRTRGLFLDRRAFLVSYDPAQDDEPATTLGRVLGAVVPVLAGINLEYYFSYVDATGYGCGTKLPHNVVGYLGVMDGHQSDLRTGLPWQMTEIHEPVRLTLVVEATAAAFAGLMAADAALGRLVTNRWLRVALMHPQTGALSVLGATGARPHDREAVALPIVAESRDWYQGRREHLACACVTAGEAVA